MIDLSKNINVELEQLSIVLGGMISGSQITRYFQIAALTDKLGEGFTKHKRIFNAFAYELNNYKNDSKIITFIECVANPSRFSDVATFNNTKEQLNKILLLLGCELFDDGKIRQAKKASSLSDALMRTNKLKAELENRNIHSMIMKYCSEEYLVNDYFHACFEAVKGTLKRLKEMVHSLEDGNKLIDIVFSSTNPLIVINKMETQSQKNEFEGLKNLFLFLIKSVRNYDAHETRLGNEIELNKALDIFVCISLVNKYLDNAQITCFVN